jgi:ankyrin repeat protein
MIRQLLLFISIMTSIAMPLQAAQAPEVQQQKEATPVELDMIQDVHRNTLTETALQSYLDDGADIDAQNSYGKTALIEAASKGHTAIAHLLLNKNADPNKKDAVGYTPLMWAIYFGCTDLAELLIEHEADVNAQSDDGTTALMEAAVTGRIAPIKLLLKHGAKVNVHDTSGQTPLQMAIASPSSNHAALVTLLLKHSAPLNQQPHDGRIVMWQAVERDMPDIIQILINHGAAIDEQDINGWTNLMWAEKLQKNEARAVLLQNKANPWIMSDDEKTIAARLHAENEEKPQNKKLSEAIIKKYVDEYANKNFYGLHKKNNPPKAYRSAHKWKKTLKSIKECNEPEDV